MQIRFLVALVILIGTSRDSIGVPVSSGELITDFGRHSAVNGVLKISISARDGRLEIERGKYYTSLTVTNPSTGQISTTYDASITNTYSLDNIAHTNWFVFVENESRVWSYDGKESLSLLTMDAVGAKVYYSPCAFPGGMPDQVRIHLPEAMRSEIANAVALKLYVVSASPIEGGRFIDTKRLPKLGYIAEHADLVLTNLADVWPSKSSAIMIDTNRVVSQVGGGREWPVVNIKLHPDDSQRLKALTEQSIGKRMLIVLGDQPFSAPTVRAPLESGFVLESTNENELKIAQKLLEKIVSRGQERFVE